MRKALNKSEKKALSQRLSPYFFFSKQDVVVLVDQRYYMVGDELLFVERRGTLMPTIRALLKKNYLKQVVVDKGAVPFMAKGADLMRPGITGIDESIAEGDLISIVDEAHRHPIAVGEALCSGKEMAQAKTGKVAKNIHHAGDDYWNYNS